MKLDRLFHVLVVVGGASAATACETDDDEARRGPGPDAAVDAAAGGDGDGGAEGQPCFCDVAACCDRSAEPARLESGFTCCWSTTCP